MKIGLLIEKLYIGRFRKSRIDKSGRFSLGTFWYDSMHGRTKKMPARKLFRIRSVLIGDGDDQDDDYDEAWEEILCYRISSNQPGNPNQPAYFILFRPKCKTIKAGFLGRYYGG